MTNTEYNDLLEKHPNLTAHGYGIQLDPKLGSNYSQIFNNMRQELRESLQAFNSCVTWIDAHPFYERGWSSYTLKHEVENWIREQGGRIYIPHGAFILAAIVRGLRLERIPDDLGVFVE